MDSSNDILCFCRGSNFSGIKKCLEKGISPNFQNSEGESPLQVAAAFGFSNIVNLLVENGALIDLSNNYGWTPLILAARYGHISTVALLLKLKAKVNICNKLGISPIIAAIWSGSLPIVKLLVEAGAIINFLSSDNPSNECDLTGLMAASLEGHEDILKFLLEKGANVHQTSPVTGISPLMLAACEGHKTVVKIIVEFGCNIEDVNICGRSALDYAVECGNNEVSTYLKNSVLAKCKPEFYSCAEDIPVVKIDSADTSMHGNSTSMCMSHDLSPRSGFYSETSDCGRLSSCDRLHPKKSHTETKVKEWIGGVAQHLQNKMFTHMSSRLSSSKSPNLEVQYGEESMNDVFEPQNAFLDEDESEEFKPSMSLSPDQYLAGALKEHTVGALKPPFPSCSYSRVMKNLKVKKGIIDNYPKPHINSLQLPRLLQKYMKKQFEHSTEDSFRKSTPSSKGIDGNMSTLQIATAERENISSVLSKSSELKNEGKFKSSTSQDSEVQNVPDTLKSTSISDNSLSALLGKESLQKYAEHFSNHEIDLNTFQELTKEDLTDIGIQNSGSQRKIIELIQRLKNKG